MVDSEELRLKQRESLHPCRTFTIKKHTCYSWAHHHLTHSTFPPNLRYYGTAATSYNPVLFFRLPTFHPISELFLAFVCSDFLQSPCSINRPAWNKIILCLSHHFHISHASIHSVIVVPSTNFMYKRLGFYQTLTDFISLTPIFLLFAFQALHLLLPCYTFHFPQKVPKVEESVALTSK